MSEETTIKVKPGWKTTEFWLSLIAGAVGVAAAIGKITPEQGSALTDALIQLGGIVAAVAAAFGYSISRGQAKR